MRQAISFNPKPLQLVKTMGLEEEERKADAQFQKEKV